MDALARALRSPWVRAALTAGLLALVALQVDWGAAAERLRDGRWELFAAAVGLLAAALAIGGLRWHLFLHGARIAGPPGRTARAYAIGTFANNFLPTGFGGDALRAFLIVPSRAQVVRALTSVAADRASALGCLFVVAWVGVALDRDAVPDTLVASLAGATAAAGVAAATLLAAGGAGGRGPARRLPDRVRRWGADARETLRTYLTDGPLLAATTVIGIAYQSLIVAETVLIARAIGVELSFAVIAVTVLLVLIATLAPISIAGFGVREGSFVVLLGEAGVGATDATLVSLLSVAAMALASSPGALAILTGGRRGEEAGAPATFRRAQG